MCPSRWLVGMNGLFKEIAKDLVKVEPTNKLPISPGPQVAVKTSISFGSILFLSNKSLIYQFLNILIIFWARNNLKLFKKYDFM